LTANRAFACLGPVCFAIIGARRQRAIGLSPLANCGRFFRPVAWIWAAALSRLGESMEFMRKLETLAAILRRPPAI
jgi:hypothetical protein